MEFIKKYLIPVLFGSILGGLGTLSLSLYADLLPVLLPSLSSINPQVFLKLIMLLIVLLLLVSALAVMFFYKSKEYKPRSLFGKKYGLNWSAELNYTKTSKEVDIDLQFLCPKHGVFLGTKSAEIPLTTYHSLWCEKCKKTYEMNASGDSIYVEDAKNVLRRNILGKLRL